MARVLEKKRGQQRYSRGAEVSLQSLVYITKLHVDGHTCVACVNWKHRAAQLRFMTTACLPLTAISQASWVRTCCSKRGGLSARTIPCSLPDHRSAPPSSSVDLGGRQEQSYRHPSTHPCSSLPHLTALKKSSILPLLPSGSNHHFAPSTSATLSF
jgi:hypothetical protein